MILLRFIKLFLLISKLFSKRLKFGKKRFSGCQSRTGKIQLGLCLTVNRWFKSGQTFLSSSLVIRRIQNPCLIIIVLLLNVGRRVRNFEVRSLVLLKKWVLSMVEVSTRHSL